MLEASSYLELMVQLNTLLWQYNQLGTFELSLRSSNLLKNGYVRFREPIRSNFKVNIGCLQHMLFFSIARTNVSLKYAISSIVRSMCSSLYMTTISRNLLLVYGHKHKKIDR